MYLIATEIGLFNIGRSKNPKKRFWSYKSHSPIECVLFLGFEYDDSIFDVEVMLHRIFSRKKVHGEWFHLSAQDLRYIINQTNCEGSIEFDNLIDKLDTCGFFEVFKSFQELSYRDTILDNLKYMDNFYCEYQKIEKAEPGRMDHLRKREIIQIHDEIFN